MPTLPQPYTAKVGEAPIFGGRRAEASDFYQGDPNAGREIQAAAQAALDRIEQDEARKAVVGTAEIRAKYAKELDAATLSGADLTKIKASMDAEIAKIGEGFQTKQGKDALRLHGANTGLMYDEQANRIEVQRAGANARLEAGKFIVSSGQIMQSNPGYLPAAEAQLKDLIATFPKLRPDQRAEIEASVKKDLNMAAALASARIDGASTLKRLDAGEWDLTPEQRNSAMNSARVFDEIKRSGEDREKARIKEERKDAAVVSRDKYAQQILKGNLSRQLENDIITDPAFAHFPEYREHLVTFMRADAKRRAGEERRSDPVVKNNLILMAMAPEGTPGKLYNSDAVWLAAKEGKINATDLVQITGIIGNLKDSNNRNFGTKLYGRVQTVSAAMRSAPEYQVQPELAASIQLELMSRVEKAADAMRNGTDGGKPRSPDGLLDPESKDYFFKPGTIKAVANDVKAQKRTAEEALLKEKAKPVASVEEMLAAKDGEVLIDPTGAVIVMSPQVRKQLGAKKKKDGPTFPIVPSGETDDKRRRREEDEYNRKYRKAFDLPGGE